MKGQPRSIPLGDVYHYSALGVEARKRAALRESCPPFRLAEERIAWFDGYDAQVRVESLPPVLRFPGHGFCFYMVVRAHEQPSKGDFYLIPPAYGLPLVMLARTHRTGFFTTLKPTHKAIPVTSYRQGEPIE